MAVNKVIVTKNKTRIVHVSEVGPRGPQGPLPATFGDIGDVTLESLNNKDVLQYDTSINQWVNNPQEDIVDGGNF